MPLTFVGMDRGRPGRALIAVRAGSDGGLDRGGGGPEKQMDVGSVLENVRTCSLVGRGPRAKRNEGGC